MTAEFNSRLIAMVAKNPMIYDNLHPEYKSMAKTNMIWRDISEQLGVSGKFDTLSFVSLHQFVLTLTNRL